MMKNEETLNLLREHIDTHNQTVINSLFALLKKTYDAGFDQGFEEGMEAAAEEDQN